MIDNELRANVASGIALGLAQAQNEPILVPDAVDYQKLLPILPEPPSGWTADKPEGSTKTPVASESQTSIGIITKAKGTKRRPRRLAYWILLLIRIMSVPPQLHGITIAKAAKVTAKLSPSMATPVLKRLRKKANTPPFG